MRAREALRRTRLRLGIRWKLALVSAGLTFAILLLFAIVVGALTERKLHSSFDSDLRATAADLQEQIRLRPGRDGDLSPAVPPDLFDAAAAGGAAIRVIDRDNRVVAQTPRNAPNLGPPADGVRDVPGYRVVSRPLFAASLARSDAFGPFDRLPLDGTVAFVQYGRSERSVDATIERERLFLALGVIGGTGLALLAGLAVARRAMRPIAGLTGAAQEIARTRDPAVSLPQPVADDEVSELARTLAEMLGELDAARAETEAALDRQREFVADASHELRTPLTSILANLDMLTEALDGHESLADCEAAEMAASALRSSRRMRRLVADLLLLARADAGRQVPHRREDLAAIVREATAEAAPLATGHTLSLHAPEDEVPVDGVADDLHRMALNLIENALVHTPPGTPVTVSVAPGDGVVTLEVADRGPGVPAEARAKVFDRFARAFGDAGLGGSGLGLAIVRAVAEAHGGTTALDDAEGGGARFSVSLPEPGGGLGAGEPAPPEGAPALGPQSRPA
ncbi:MAG: HAMP domain-containing sensor histidine kinase [Solirubrobacteraceae bacterium]